MKGVFRIRGWKVYDFVKYCICWEYKNESEKSDNLDNAMRLTFFY